MESSLRNLPTSELRRELRTLEKEYENLIAEAKQDSRDQQIVVKMSELEELITKTANALEGEIFGSSTSRYNCESISNFYRIVL